MWYDFLSCYKLIFEILQMNKIESTFIQSSISQQVRKVSLVSNSKNLSKTCQRSSQKSRTTDAQRGNSLHCTAKNSLPLPNFQVRLKHILSATLDQFFRYFCFMPSLGVRSPCVAYICICQIVALQLSNTNHEPQQWFMYKLIKLKYTNVHMHSGCNQNSLQKLCNKLDLHIELSNHTSLDVYNIF